jgi:hypothetical protein
MQSNWIVCGWFTPDYRPYWNNLRQNLDAIGAPHDFVEVRKSDGGWEANTMRKPKMILQALYKHPGKTVIFLDVDCTVPGGWMGLEALAAMPGDVAFVIETKWRRRTRRWLFVRSGTMVFKPTTEATQFVHAWCKECAVAPKYAVDQDSLVVAMGRVPEVSFSNLPIKFCAVDRDNHPAPVILHDSASAELGGKAGKFTRLFHRLSGAKLAA